MKGLQIGRIVHYVSEEGNPHRAAIITRVHDATRGAVDLHIMPPGGSAFDHYGIDHSEDPKEGTWHWPERVD
ncbi:MAG: hypothetical protein M1548_05765 [Actinobacteria bacterium]|nr:hypothetical protein [Actinomycetota bacterium]